MTPKFTRALFFFAALFMVSAAEARADTIVIALSQPNVIVPLLIPEGQVITSVHYSADYTITITKPCSLIEPCDTPLKLTFTRIFVDSAFVFGRDFLPSTVTTGSFSTDVNPAQYVNFTFGTARLFIDDNRVSTVLTNGVLTIQTAPAPTPEPATFILLGTGLAGALAGARRRRRARAG